MEEFRFCIHCGKKFLRPLKRTGRSDKIIPLPNYHWNKKKFCSKKCRSAHSIKKNYPRSKNYQKKWREDNKEKVKESRLIYISNPETKQNLEQKRKEYYKKNRKIIQEKHRKLINDSKNRILKMYKNKCSICGYNEVLDIHHLKGHKKYKGDYLRNNFDLSKVIILCPNCHTKIHRGLLKEEEIKRKVRS